MFTQHLDKRTTSNMNTTMWGRLVGQKMSLYTLHALHVFCCSSVNEHCHGQMVFFFFFLSLLTVVLYRCGQETTEWCLTITRQYGNQDFVLGSKTSCHDNSEKSWTSIYQCIADKVIVFLLERKKKKKKRKKGSINSVAVHGII